MMCNGPVSWASRKQKSTATSSTEAEYYALHMATCEALWFHNLFEELGYPFTNPITIFCDNQSTIKLAKNGEYHARTKHIRVQYHQVRDALEANLIELKYVPTEEMVADGLTKPLPKSGHEKFIRMMKMQDCNLTDDGDQHGD